MRVSRPLVEQAQIKVASYLVPGDIAVDATMGNGFDTLFLAESVGVSGQVYAFDVQNEALKATAKRLTEAALDKNCHLLNDSHCQLLSYLGKAKVPAIRCAMFNLGYLPGSDKAQQTTPQTSLAALKGCLSLLQRPGIISVIAYTGHEGGRAEAEAIKAWAVSLNKAIYQVSIEIPKVKRNSPPELILIEAL